MFNSDEYLTVPVSIPKVPKVLPIFKKCSTVIDNYIDKVDGLNHEDPRLKTYKYKVQSPLKTHGEMIIELEKLS